MPNPKPNHILGMTHLQCGIFAGLGTLVVILICVIASFALLNGQQLLTPLVSEPSQTPNAIPTFDTPVPFTGKWQVYTSTSAFDGSTTVALNLEAENYVQGWLTTSLPSLVLRCKEGKVDAYVNNGTQPDVEYGLYNSATVRIRFDQSQAYEIVADKSTDGDSLFFRDPYGMIMDMMRSREMVFGFTPFNANPAVTTFNLNGLTTVIKPLEQSCHWNGFRPTSVP